MLHDEKLSLKIFIGYLSCTSTVLCTDNIRVKNSLKSLSLGNLNSSWGFHQNLILFKALTSSKLFTLLTVNFLSPYISLPERGPLSTALPLSPSHGITSNPESYFLLVKCIYLAIVGWQTLVLPFISNLPFGQFPRKEGWRMKSILFMSYVYVMRNLIAEFFVK